MFSPESEIGRGAQGGANRAVPLASRKLGGRLLSLWDMLRFSGVTFYELGQLLSFLASVDMIGLESIRGTLKALKVSTEGIDDPQILQEGIRVECREHLPAYKVHIENAGLHVSLKTFNNLCARLDDPKLTSSGFSSLVAHLQQVIEYELEDTNLWQVPREHLRFFDVDLFKVVESNKSTTAHRDIKESGKCLAFDRGTASVFHLMRVMECGLRSLGASLNNPDLDPKRNPSWETILKKCDNELQKPLKDRSSEWRQDEVFFSTAVANLRAVKNAWRNTSLHIERDYTPEEAEDVWNAVKAFIRHLATRLS
jgi:hypothetical protein